jgi:hypothetical protein
MHYYSKRILVFLFVTVFAVVLCGSSVSAKDSSAEVQMDQGLMIADVALARPVGAVATVVGLAFFVVSSPFSALGGNTHEAWETLVVSPAAYTFKRPLGDFDNGHPPGREQE